MPKKLNNVCCLIYRFLKAKYFCEKKLTNVVANVLSICDGVGYIPITSTNSFNPQ